MPIAFVWLFFDSYAIMWDVEFSAGEKEIAELQLNYDANVIIKFQLTYKIVKKAVTDFYDEVFDGL